MANWTYLYIRRWDQLSYEYCTRTHLSTPHCSPSLVALSPFSKVAIVMVATSPPPG